jgi:hypothetical protein
MSTVNNFDITSSIIIHSAESNNNNSICNSQPSQLQTKYGLIRAKAMQDNNVAPSSKKIYAGKVKALIEWITRNYPDLVQQSESTLLWELKLPLPIPILQEFFGELSEPACTNCYNF